MMRLRTNLHLDPWLNLTLTPAFLRLVQPLERSWWRPIATAALVAVGGMVLAVIGYLISGLINLWLIQTIMLHRPFRWPANLFQNAEISRVSCAGCLMGGVTETVTLGGMSAGFLVAVLTCASLVNHRSPRTWATAAPHFRWRLFLAGLALFALLLGVTTAVPEALHGWPDRPMFWKADEAVSIRLLYLVVTLLVFPMEAAFEEVLCRGWLLQTTAAFTRNLPVILVFNSLIFSALHIDNDVGRNVSRAALGVALSYGALRLGGLEFGMGVHAANNLVILLLAQTLPQAEKLAPSTALGVAENVAVSAGAIALIELAARWAPLRRWAGVEGAA
jgi:membrane protease YdiL (CAAX protease family)